MSDAVMVAFIAGGLNFVASLFLDRRDRNTMNEKMSTDKRDLEDKLKSEHILISKLFQYKDDHEKESANVRLEFSKQISELTAMFKVAQTQYGEIIRRLDELREEFHEYRKSKN